MAIGIVCPKILQQAESMSEGGKRKRKCGTRNPLGALNCSNCKYPFKKGGLEYYIDYRDGAKRRYEYIGSSKKAAESRLAEIRKNQIEDRIIHRDKSVRLNLKGMIEWYLSLKDVKAKKSYKRDIQLLDSISRILGLERKISEINPGCIELYCTERLSEDSPAKKNSKIQPATVNKEISQLNTMLNKAVSHGKLDTNPLAGKLKKLKEDNVRERVLLPEEFERLLENLHSPLREMALIAFYLSMRQREIIDLTWEKIDLTNKMIKLESADTKTGFKRKVPIHPRVLAMFESLERNPESDKVFMIKGKPVMNFSGNLKSAWDKAVRQSELGDFTFHDLRHCAINNLRLAGNYYFTIMTIS